MKRAFIFLINILCSVAATSQGNSEREGVLQYLKQNLKVYFISQPNTEPLAINTINTESVATNTNGIIFGTATNNGMTISALLVQSLFKDRNNNGDGNLQDYIYFLLKQRDKPVQLFFINDVQAPLTPEAVSRLSVDTQNVNGLRVWPRVAQNVETNLAGSLLFGENILAAFNDVEQAKKMLVNLMVSIAIKDFRSMHLWWVFNTPPDAGAKWYFTYALMDTRLKTFQGICNSIVHAFNVGTRIQAINWYMHQKASLIHWTPVSLDARGNEDIPAAYWLYNRIQSEYLRNRISDLPSPQFGNITRSAYRVFQFLPVNGPPRDFAHDRLMIRDEQILGLLGYYFIVINGFQNYLRCLSYADNRLQTAQPADRLTVIIENLCLGNTDGKTLSELAANPPTQKRYLLGLAFFDYFSNFSSNGTAAGYSDLSGGTFSEDIIRLYTPSIRRSIIDAVRQVRNTVSGETEIFFGELMAIKQVLNIN
jgi:hypothetical protein